MFTQVLMYRGKYHPAVIILWLGLPYLSNSLPWSPQCLLLPSSLSHYKSKLHWWNARWRYHKSIKTWNPCTWSPKRIWEYFGKLNKCVFKSLICRYIFKDNIRKASLLNKRPLRSLLWRTRCHKWALRWKAWKTYSLTLFGFNSLQSNNIW